MSKVLVVVGDDAGLDPARDAALLAAADAGVLRAASVVANGPTAEAFVAAARSRPGLSLGLHVNLTSGAPSARARPFTLLGPDGCFPADAAEVGRRAVDGRVSREEVEQEVVAQWRRLVALGATPTHVDGHHHVHVLPAVADGVLAALRFVGAAVHVRVPAEEMPPEGVPPVDRPVMPLGTAMLSRLRMAQVRAGHAGIATVGYHADRLLLAVTPPLRRTDGFVGLAVSAAPRLDVLRAALAAAPGPVVEWMTHPGRMPSRPTPFSSDPRRDEELALLVAPATRAALEADGWRLASFADVPR
ncbi:MAG: ChbG/HpnK family deacetylase [Planctomycetota bacterium]